MSERRSCLGIGDVDFDQGHLTIRNSKYGKSRQSPLHPSTIDALGGYAAQGRDERRPRPKAPSFFTSTVGNRLIRDNASTVFRRLVIDAGLIWPDRHRPPRLHDFRHRFAVRCLLGWYRDGLDVERRLPLLSTFMGHVGPDSTYWYLTAVPELLEIVAERHSRQCRTAQRGRQIQNGNHDHPKQSSRFGPRCALMPAIPAAAPG